MLSRTDERDGADLQEGAPSLEPTAGPRARRWARHRRRRRIIRAGSTVGLVAVAVFAIQLLDLELRDLMPTRQITDAAEDSDRSEPEDTTAPDVEGTDEPGGTGEERPDSSVADASPSPESTDLDPIGAAVSWSQEGFADGAAAAALISGVGALGEGMLTASVQVHQEAPLLLTDPNRLDPRASTELERLDVESVTIVGNETTVSAAVEAALVDAGYDVARLGGDSPITTATAVAGVVLPDAEQAVVTAVPDDGMDLGPGAPADALAATAEAAISRAPLLFTENANLSEPTRAYLRSSAVTSVIVVGDALSERVVQQLGWLDVDVEQHAGSDDARTLAALAAWGYTGDPPSETVVIAGDHPAGWLSSFGAVSGGDDTALVFARGPNVPTVSHQLVFGGPGTLRCGPFVDLAACQQFEAAHSATPFGGQDTSFFVFDDFTDPEGGSPGIGTLHATGLPDAMCITVRNLETSQPGTVMRLHASGRTTGAVARFRPPDHSLGFLMDCAVGLDAADVADVLDNPQGYRVTLEQDEPGEGFTGRLRHPVRTLSGRFTPVDGAGPPGTDDAGTAGRVRIFHTEDPNTLCWDIDYTSDPLEPPATMAWLRRGDEGSRGPSVMELSAPTSAGGAAGCRDDVHERLMSQLLEDPEGHYVTVHNEAQPLGALRAQLTVESGGE